MYGLEKEKKPFQFDLEVELKKDQKKAKLLLEQIEANTLQIKQEIREGKTTQDLDNLGTLLQGYTALKKVLTKAKAK